MSQRMDAAAVEVHAQAWDARVPSQARTLTSLIISINNKEKNNNVKNLDIYGDFFCGQRSNLFYISFLFILEVYISMLIMEIKSLFFLNCELKKVLNILKIKK